MRPKDLVLLAICLGIPLAVGGMAGWATAGGLDSWYRGLEKPFFNPPDSVFGPVWTLLYVLMGISLFLVWRTPAGPLRRRALAVFWAQLALNFAWSFVFFTFHRIGLALLNILLIVAGVALMIGFFAKVHRTAAVLQIPYLLWVGFATLLNSALWKLN